MINKLFEQNCCFCRIKHSTVETANSNINMRQATLMVVKVCMMFLRQITNESSITEMVSALVASLVVQCSNLCHSRDLFQLFSGQSRFTFQKQKIWTTIKKIKELSILLIAKCGHIRDVFEGRGIKDADVAVDMLCTGSGFNFTS